MIGGAISNAINHVVTPYLQTETFDGNKVPESENKSAKLVLVSLVTVVIIFLLILLVGKYLWNSVLVDLIPSIKPAKSIWQILGLSILVSLIAPGCTCGVPL